MNFERFTAGVVLTFAIPILAVKLPWFGATLIAMQNALSELGLVGTELYHADLTRRINRGIFAITLYIVGFVSFFGLCRIATTPRVHKITRSIVWVMVILTSAGIIIFHLDGRGGSTHLLQLVTFVFIPIILLVLAVFALFKSSTQSDK